MGKVTYRELPEDDPIFKRGWSIATVRRPIKNNKNSSKNKVVVKDDKEVFMATNYDKKNIKKLFTSKSGNF